MMQVAPARLAKIVVRGLFGHLRHAIAIDPDVPFVILFGANGVGKTTVLRLTHALLASQLEYLADTPFSELILEFDDGTSVNVIRSTPDESGEDPVLHIGLSRPGVDVVLHTYSPQRGISPRLRHWLESETSWRRVEHRLWRDDADGEILPENELAELFSHMDDRPIRSIDRVSARRSMDPEMQTFLRGQAPLYIPSDRLITEGRMRADRHRAGRAVDRYNRELRAFVSATLAADALESQELDRTFPARLLELPEDAIESERWIREEYQEQSAMRATLREIGIISGAGEIELPIGDIAEWKLRTLRLVLSDSRLRLERLIDATRQVKLFHELLNSRLVDKHVRITDAGMSIRLDATGRLIHPHMLSSGEQHQLILIYGLIFSGAAGRLVLIDEPEISLHVLWQESFLDDLARILEVSGSVALVATHSPQIIGKWHSRMLELKTRAEHG